MEASPGSTVSSEKLLEWSGQGSVHIIHDGLTPIAAKHIRASRSTAINCEVKALRSLQNAHPHVTHVYGLVRGLSGSLYVFMEAAEMDLHDAIGCRDRRALGEHSFVREWMLQIAHALSYGHQLGVAHRDVKPENVLLVPASDVDGDGASDSLGSNHSCAGKHSRTAKPALKALLVQSNDNDNAAALREVRKHFVAKLCDYGSAAVRSLDPAADAAAADVARGQIRGWAGCGSRRYAAPEVYRAIVLNLTPQEAEGIWPRGADGTWDGLLQRGYDAAAADVWSFGVMLFIAVTGLQPFKHACVNDPRFRAFLREKQRHVMSDELVAPRSAIWNDGSDTGVPPPGSTRTLNPDAEAALRPWDWPYFLSPALVHLLEGCMQVRPAERISMSQVVSHPWFANPQWRPGTSPTSANSSTLSHSGTDDVRQQANGNSTTAPAGPNALEKSDSCDPTRGSGSIGSISGAQSGSGDQHSVPLGGGVGDPNAARHDSAAHLAVHSTGAAGEQRYTSGTSAQSTTVVAPQGHQHPPEGGRHANTSGTAGSSESSGTSIKVQLHPLAKDSRSNSSQAGGTGQSRAPANATAVVAPPAPASPVASPHPRPAKVKAGSSGSIPVDIGPAPLNVSPLTPPSAVTYAAGHPAAGSKLTAVPSRRPILGAVQLSASALALEAPRGHRPGGSAAAAAAASGNGGPTPLCDRGASSRTAAISRGAGGAMGGSRSGSAASGVSLGGFSAYSVEHVHDMEGSSVGSRGSSSFGGADDFGSLSRRSSESSVSSLPSLKGGAGGVVGREQGAGSHTPSNPLAGGSTGGGMLQGLLSGDGPDWGAQFGGGGEFAFGGTDSYELPTANDEAGGSTFFGDGLSPLDSVFPRGTSHESRRSSNEASTRHNTHGSGFSSGMGGSDEGMGGGTGFSSTPPHDQ